MKFETLVYSMLVFGLFGALIITAIINVGTTYNKDLSEFSGSSSDLNLYKFNNTISDIEKDAEEFQEVFNRQNIFSIVAGIVVEGIFDIGIDVGKLIISPFKVLSNIMTNVLQVPSMVTNVLMAIVIFTIIFGVWYLIKVGE